MKGVFTSLIAAAVIAINAVVAEEVFTLTTENFKQTLADNEYVLAEFYAPWCGHCKALAPEYEKAALGLLEFEPKVLLAKIDATQEEALAKEFGVQGFPTMKWFVNGEAREYGGGRTESTIISWIKKKVGDPATKLEDVAALEKIKEDNEVVVVGVFATAEDAAAFTKAASDEEEVPFAVSIGNADVAKEAGVESGIVVFKKFDEGRAEFTGDVNSKEEIADFVGGNSLPTIVPFSQENAPKIFGGKIKSHQLIFVDSSDAAAKDAVLEQVKPVAVANKGKMLFVTVDKSDDRILEFFGITESDLPTVRIVNMGEGAMKKYALEGEITSENLEKFVADYNDDKLEAQLKSADVPESNDGDVFIAVGKNFNELVGQEGRGVLVEFYAPWCGHCKKLAPIWDELGANFKGNEKVVIAKMDSTENEVEQVSVSGFPTLKWFPGGDAPAEDYEGGRELKDLVAFIEGKLA